MTAFEHTRVAPYAIAAAAVGAAVLLFPAPPSEGEGAWGAAEAAACPDGMVSIRGNFCIDRHEAHLVVVDKARTSTRSPKIVGRHSPYKPVGGATVMAKSSKGRVPQGHISRNQAEQACINAGKRLCTDEEWLEACRGKKPTKYPYGEAHVEGRCNDKGVSGFNLLFGPGNNTPPEPHVYTKENMNDARLNQVEGTVAKTGTFGKCKNSFGIFDMVGNLHEWTSAPSGTFRGGYYLDTRINGEGCDYKTTAHDAKYFDYSTGFRCCQGGAEQKRVDKLVKQAEKDARDKKKASKEARADAKDKSKSKSKDKGAKKAKKEPTKTASARR